MPSFDFFFSLSSASCHSFLARILSLSSQCCPGISKIPLLPPELFSLLILEIITVLQWFPETLESPKSCILSLPPDLREAVSATVPAPGDS